MKMIEGRLKEAQDKQKSYVDVHRVDRGYKVRDKVFLQVRPQKSSIKFGKGTKLSSWYMGTFKILERKVLVSCCLALSSSLDRMHDVFHVSILRYYILDRSHVIGLIHLQMLDEGALTAKPICILEQCTQQF
jgi:hypothetical protein